MEAVIEPAGWVSDADTRIWETSASIPVSNGKHPLAWQTS